MPHFEVYLKQGEPSLVEKTHIWQTAIGLQDVDDLKNGIYATSEYLFNFFGNLLLGENNVLENRYLHIGWQPPTES